MLDEKIDSIASNPIYLYRFIKDMQWFADDVYNPKIQTVASNTGNYLCIVPKLSKKQRHAKHKTVTVTI